MIKIRNLQKKYVNKRVRISATIDIPDDAASKWYQHSLEQEKTKEDYSYVVEDYLDWIQGERELYYEVDKEFESFLVTETSDCFVAGILYYAMASGHDIFCEKPVSQQLLENLNNTLIPLVCKASNVPIIKVIAKPFYGKIGEGTEIGTGMSAGVDSLHTVYLYGTHTDPEQKLTVLTQFNVGSERYYFKHEKNMEGLERYEKQFQETKKSRVKRAKEVAEALGMKYLQVDSNIQDIYQGLFEESHIYRTASAVLALQKLFKKYYIASSGCSHLDYQPSIYKDPAHYEQISVPMMSTVTTRIVSASKAYTRIDKINDLKDFPLAKRYLCVCGKHEKPCYHCGKERRTFVILDILNCSENFSEVFDINKIKEVRNETYYWLLVEKDKKNPATLYIYEKAEEKGLIPQKAKMKYFLHKMKHLFH
ncbi:MAG: hypothetical protein Q4C77_05730 [Eubacteriales bacterium]|nr:hypothetical protein [Eubacteriales bacterium]